MLQKIWTIPFWKSATGSLAVDKKDNNKFFDFNINYLECHIQGNAENPSPEN